MLMVHRSTLSLQNGKLPRSLPALRAMEMALRTNSFAMPNRGARSQDRVDPTDDSDSEMEYMPPLHSKYEYTGNSNGHFFGVLY